MSFEVCEVGFGTHSSSGNTGLGNFSRQVTTTVKQEFRIKYNGGGNTGYPNGGDAISESDVACAAGLPQVGYSTFSSRGGQVMYNAVCVGKDVRRDRGNKSMFMATCTFKTPVMDAEACVGNPVLNLTDISPVVTASVGGKEQVLYSDYYGAQCWKLPSVNVMFDSPITTQRPRLKLSISQFEASITDDQMQNRSYVVNSGNYRGLGVNRWRCIVQNAVEQQVTLSDGAGGTTDVTAVRVTYNVERSDDYYIDPNNGQNVIYGWQATAPLVSPKIISSEPPAGMVGPMQPRLVRKADLTNGEEQMAYIWPDGTERTTGQDRPDYLRFQAYPAVSFGFLQA